MTGVSGYFLTTSMPSAAIRHQSPAPNQRNANLARLVTILHLVLMFLVMVWLFRCVYFFLCRFLLAGGHVQISHFSTHEAWRIFALPGGSRQLATLCCPGGGTPRSKCRL